MRKQSGFTVIELIVAIIFLGIVIILSLIQVNNIKNETNNSRKKTTINALYYSLEEYFYKQNKYYPDKIEDNTLPTIDKNILKDLNGNRLGSSNSEYRYEPTNCQDGKCKSYKLRCILKDEEDYVKESRNK